MNHSVVFKSTYSKIFNKIILHIKIPIKTRHQDKKRGKHCTKSETLTMSHAENYNPCISYSSTT